MTTAMTTASVTAPVFTPPEGLLAASATAFLDTVPMALLDADDEPWAAADRPVDSLAAPLAQPQGEPLAEPPSDRPADAVEAAAPTGDDAPEPGTGLLAAPERVAQRHEPATGTRWALPGLRWGLQPQRRDDEAAWYDLPWQRLRAVWRPRELRLTQVWMLRLLQQHWESMPSAEALQQRASLRATLAASGLTDELRDQALACVAAQTQRVLRRNPFDTQLLCAQQLMNGLLVEMATGEGKTLAVAMAAAACALSGTPVHVMTANDYLAMRDARQHAPLFVALGLRVAVITARSTPEQRRIAYAADITYATAREIAFDHLRDGQLLQARSLPGAGDLGLRAAGLAGEGPPPLLQRGLCCAILDEADSLLIDEAVTPLVLAEADDDATMRAACFQALAMAGQLQTGVHYEVDHERQRVLWTVVGQLRLEALGLKFGGAWLNRHHREDLVGQALVAQQVLQPGRDYLVHDGRVELLDRITGRTAQGRVWSRQLHTLVELKEHCKPTPATRTAAQTSFQRFFARYHRLSGTSGTLQECRAELAAVYGLPVVRMPLRRESLRETYPTRSFDASAQREAEVVRRIQYFQALGRPVLVGVASVNAAEALSVALQAAGVAHRVLDARHEAEEARIVAEAGQSGAVTVATAMAGRGTDIELGPCVAAMGGLHVIDMLDTPCARTRRQLVGRAARQGDPGSAETWLAADADSWSQGPLDAPGSTAPGWAVEATSRLQQLHHRWTTRRQRRRLLKQDLTWQRRLGFHKRHA
jgi:preprotein translocase subunit SecA